MTELEAALVEVASLLEELRMPYALIGGLAVAIWGEPRATLDVDVSVWIEPRDLETTILSLCSRLRVLATDPLSFARQTHVLPTVSSSGVRVDLVLASLPAEKEVIERALPKLIEKTSIRVTSVEDLIWMKLISERARDFDDARRLLRRFRDSLDRNYLEPRLVELANAFARQDILDTFDRETKRP